MAADAAVFFWPLAAPGKSWRSTAAKPGSCSWPRAGRLSARAHHRGRGQCGANRPTSRRPCRRLSTVAGFYGLARVPKGCKNCVKDISENDDPLRSWAAARCSRLPWQPPFCCCTRTRRANLPTTSAARTGGCHRCVIAADADDAADPDLDGGVARLSRGCRRAGAGAHHRASNRRAQLKQDAVTDHGSWQRRHMTYRTAYGQQSVPKSNCLPDGRKAV